MTERNNVEVFILMNREVLKPEAKPGKQIRYDDNMQLWVNQQTGQPIVLQFFQGLNQLCSEFGETDMTKTQEGADQPEVSPSPEFGETTITRTQEGADQSEMLTDSGSSVRQDLPPPVKEQTKVRFFLCLQLITFVSRFSNILKKAY